MTGRVWSAKPQQPRSQNPNDPIWPRRAFVFLDGLPINKPEVFIAQAHTRFDDNGRLTDETTRGFIQLLLDSLATWTRRLQQAR